MNNRGRRRKESKAPPVMERSAMSRGKRWRREEALPAQAQGPGDEVGQAEEQITLPSCPPPLPTAGPGQAQDYF